MTLREGAQPMPHPEVILHETRPQTPSALADVEVRPAPTLITEQEVVFGTAAALSARSTRWRTRLARVRAVIFAVPARMFVAAAAEDSPPKRRNYPSRSDFLENSRMAREMDRL